MLRLDVNAFDYVLLAIYFALVVTIGVLARRAIATSEDFLLSGRSLPAWVTGLAFISANLGRDRDPRHGRERRAVRHLDGALLLDRRRAGDDLPRPRDDAVLLRLAGAQRARSSCAAGSTGRPTCSTRVSFAAASVLTAGVNLYALALVINALIGWPIWLSIIVSAAFVLAYITLGGLSGAIYNEVLQFFVIIAGLVPLVIIGLKDVGGWGGLKAKINNDGAVQQPGAGTHVGHWTNPLGDWIGIVMGLGFVLSLRLLDDELRRGAARAVGQGPLGRAAHAADRLVPEDLHPGPDDHPRPDRGRGGPEARHAPAARLQRRDPAADEQVPAQRHAGHRAGRPARRVHGRHGRQRQLVQHRVHLRHLADLHRQGPARRLLPARSAASSPSSAS